LNHLQLVSDELLWPPKTERIKPSSFCTMALKLRWK